MPKAPKTLLDKIIVDKALDRASRLRRQYLENGMSSERLQHLEGELIENLDPIAKKWKPSTRTNTKGIRGILESGKFKNQFETGTSGGSLNSTGRRKLSDDYFVSYPDDSSREKYGFLKRPKKYGKDDVNWYGDYEVTFKPQVRKRMTFINGDSLNDYKESWKSSSPIVPGVKETYINWSGRPVSFRKDDLPDWRFPNGMRLQSVVYDLKRNPGPYSGSTEFDPYPMDDYVEAQYHGPLTIEDVEGIGIPNWHLEENPNQDLFRMRSDQYGFPLYDWDGKCIYNCR